MQEVMTQAAALSRRQFLRTGAMGGMLLATGLAGLAALRQRRKPR